MHAPTFDEAVRLWPSLSDDGKPETDYDWALLDACECAILDRDIQSVGDAVAVLKVAIDNLTAGPRSDERDIRALTSLHDWLTKDAAQRGVEEPGDVRRKA